METFEAFFFLVVYVALLFVFWLTWTRLVRKQTYKKVYGDFKFHFWIMMLKLGSLLFP